MNITYQNNTKAQIYFSKGDMEYRELICTNPLRYQDELNETETQEMEDLETWNKTEGISIHNFNEKLEDLKGKLGLVCNFPAINKTLEAKKAESASHKVAWILGASSAAVIACIAWLCYFFTPKQPKVSINKRPDIYAMPNPPSNWVKGIGLTEEEEVPEQRETD